MRYNGLTGLLLFASVGGIAVGQTDLSMPSKSEIFELVDKADQKISAFEAAVKDAKPTLDLIDAKLSRNYLDAASTAHFMIQSLHKNGPSA